MAKTIFITGGSTGIGAAAVRKFISEGWNVGFMDINEEAAQANIEKINEPERPYIDQQLFNGGLLEGGEQTLCTRKRRRT